MRNLNSEGSEICMRGPFQISFIRDDLFSSKHTTHCITLDSKLQNFPKVPVTELSTLFWSFLPLPIIMKRFFKRIFSKFPLSRKAWLFCAVHVSPCAFACAASCRWGATALPAAQAQNQKHFSEPSQQLSAWTTISDLQQNNNPPP